MNKDLKAVKDAWDPGDPETKNVKAKRDEDKVRALSDAYVEAHPDEFAELREMTQEQCVQALEVFRAAGMEDSEWKVQAWLFHHFEPQNIGGEYKATVRISNG
jgi:tRNA A37 N6-isopentenylltransferase MiaA